MPDDWKMVYVQLYKERKSKRECEDYRGLCRLSMVGIVYSRIVINHAERISEALVGEGQSGSRKGRSDFCV